MKGAVGRLEGQGAAVGGGQSAKKGGGDECKIEELWGEKRRRAGDEGAGRVFYVEATEGEMTRRCIGALGQKRQN